MMPKRLTTVYTCTALSVPILFLLNSLFVVEDDHLFRTRASAPLPKSQNQLYPSGNQLLNITDFR